MIIAVDAARRSRVGSEAGSGLHNVPVPLTSLVGRALELGRVGEIMRRTRLVTVTGPGEIGRTRLALALAERELGRRADGVWWVDLALVSEPPDVAGEVARTLGLSPARPGAAADALVKYLRDRDPLLVLDNCEHVADACAELAASLLSACGSVRVVATSRELPGVSGETVGRPEPLGSADAYRLLTRSVHAYTCYGVRVARVVRNRWCGWSWRSRSASKMTVGQGDARKPVSRSEIAPRRSRRRP